MPIPPLPIRSTILTKLPLIIFKLIANQPLTSAKQPLILQQQWDCFEPNFA